MRKAHGCASQRGRQCDGVLSLQLRMRSDCHTNDNGSYYIWYPVDLCSYSGRVTFLALCYTVLFLKMLKYSFNVDTVD